VNFHIELLAYRRVTISDMDESQDFMGIRNGGFFSSLRGFSCVQFGDLNTKMVGSSSMVICHWENQGIFLVNYTKSLSIVAYSRRVISTKKTIGMEIGIGIEWDIDIYIYITNIHQQYDI